MFKLTLVTLAISLALLIKSSEADIKPGKCPTFTSIPNLDLKSLYGPWYEVATDVSAVDPSTGCIKLTLKQNDNGGITIDVSAIQLAEGSEVKLSLLLKPDPKTPGILLFDSVAKDMTPTGPKDRPVQAKAAVVYADGNLTVLYTCFESQGPAFPMANTGFFILARNRSFDSLRQFTQAATPLIGLGIDLNDLMFTANGPMCRN